MCSLLSVYAGNPPPFREAEGLGHGGMFSAVPTQCEFAHPQVNAVTR